MKYNISSSFKIGESVGICKSQNNHIMYLIGKKSFANLGPWMYADVISKYQ